MNSMPFRQLKSFLKILIGVQYQSAEVGIIIVRHHNQIVVIGRAQVTAGGDFQQLPTPAVQHRKGSSDGGKVQSAYICTLPFIKNRFLTYEM